MKSDLFWINGPWPGRLAIMPRPRSGDWLEDEIQAWSGAAVASPCTAGRGSAGRQSLPHRFWR